MASEKEIRFWVGADDKDVWEDIHIPANATSLDGYTACATVDTVLTDYPGTLIFDNGADSMTGGIIMLPRDWLEGSSIYPGVHWMKTTDAEGAVVWGLTYRHLGNVREAAGAWASVDNGTLVATHANLAATHAFTSFSAITMTGKTSGAVIAWKLSRVVASDTYSAPVRLLSVEFNYQKQAGTRGTVDPETKDLTS
jgi:hypothetical protein